MAEKRLPKSDDSPDEARWKHEMDPVKRGGRCPTHGRWSSTERGALDRGLVLYCPVSSRGGNVGHTFVVPYDARDLKRMGAGSVVPLLSRGVPPAVTQGVPTPKPGVTRRAETQSRTPGALTPGEKGT